MGPPGAPRIPWGPRESQRAPGIPGEPLGAPRKSGGLLGAPGSFWLLLGLLGNTFMRSRKFDLKAGRAWGPTRGPGAEGALGQDL